MFQCDNAFSIIHALFQKEVKIFEFDGNSTAGGHFFLKFKMPYQELVHYYEEQLRAHSEFDAYFKYGNHGTNLCTVQRKDAYPNGPMQPQGKPLHDHLLEQIQKSSTSAATAAGTSNGAIQFPTNADAIGYFPAQQKENKSFEEKFPMLMMPTQYGEVNFETFIEELTFTLASKYTGYTDLNELRTDLGNNAGFSPELVAHQFGFPSFEVMMRSDLMLNYVQIVPIEGKLCYLPKDFSRFSHIRDAQEITQDLIHKFSTVDLNAIPTKVNPSLSERLAMMNDPIQDAAVTNSQNKFRFNEDEDMEAYIGLCGIGNVPRNEANANNGNEMSENGNDINHSHQQPAPVSSKQLKYTKCVVPNDMTDSEEEMDEDDAASVAIAPAGGTRPAVVRVSQENALPTFNLPSNNQIQNQQFGFSNFNCMTQSADLMRSNNVQIEGKASYLPKDFSRFSHFRDVQFQGNSVIKPFPEDSNPIGPMQPQRKSTILDCLLEKLEQKGPATTGTSNGSIHSVTPSDESGSLLIQQKENKSLEEKLAKLEEIENGIIAMLEEEIGPNKKQLVEMNKEIGNMREKMAEEIKKIYEDKNEEKIMNLEMEIDRYTMRMETMKKMIEMEKKSKSNVNTWMNESIEEKLSKMEEAMAKLEEEIDRKDRKLAEKEAKICELEKKIGQKGVELSCSYVKIYELEMEIRLKDQKMKSEDSNTMINELEETITFLNKIIWEKEEKIGVLENEIAELKQKKAVDQQSNTVKDFANLKMWEGETSLPPFDASNSCNSKSTEAPTVTEEIPNMELKKAYTNLFGYCAGCEQGFLQTDLARQVGDFQYHVDCFECDHCHCELTTGEEFGQDSKIQRKNRALDKMIPRILCKKDYMELVLNKKSTQMVTAVQVEKKKAFPNAKWQID